MVNVTIYSSTMDPMGIDFLIVTCWFPTWLCWALHAVAASCSHSKAGRSRCLQVQGPAFPAHGMSQATSLHCVLPLSPSSVSSQPLLHEKTAERIPAVNNSSLVYPLSIRQNPINLCSIESFTFWIIYIYIYIHISLSATSPGNTCLARASKMRTEYDSSKSIYFGLFCLPFKLSMSLFLFLFLCLEDRQHFPSQSVSISRSSIGYDQSYINHLKSSDPAPRAIAAIAPFFP